MKWIRNGLLILGSLIVALLVAELAVRMIFPQPTGITHQDRYGLGMHYPGITRYLPQFGHDVTFNSVGMRDVEHPLAKPPGVFRILLLGDSFMEALQVPFEESLPYLVEQELQKRTGKKIELINAGVGGWGTDDELRYLTSYGLAYQPDLIVVVMTLHNDLNDNLRLEWHRMDGDSLVTLQRAPMSFVDYHMTEFKAYLSTRFQLYQLWRRVRHGSEIRRTAQQLRSHVVQLFEEPTPPRITQGLKLTRLLLQQINDSATARGAHLAIVLLPIHFQLSDSGFSTALKAESLSTAGLHIDQPQRMITAVADSLNIPVVDLLPSFQKWAADTNAPLFLGWDGHWNADGHRLAAGATTEGLIRVRAVR